MAESKLAPKTSLRPRGRRTPIGATKPGSPSTRNENPLPTPDMVMNKAALGKMSMAQLKRLLDAAQSSAERTVIQEAIQAKVTPTKPNSEKKFMDKMTDKASKMSEGGLTQPTKNQTGLKKLPTAVRNKMGYFKSGGMAPSGNNDMRKSGMFK